VALLLVAPGAVGVAHATLGGDVASIEVNGRRLAAAQKIEPLETGERHELHLPSGTLVREYVSPAGRVYAVSWQGKRPPDLEELLGAYFPQLTGHGRRRSGHHQLDVTGDDLVVQSSGHNRAFRGRAWVPSLVPAAVDVETVVEAGQ
jgi:hypothetical protein